MFITSWLRDVQGVERWDNRILPTARPVTEELALMFWDRSSTHLDP